MNNESNKIKEAYFTKGEYLTTVQAAKHLLVTQTTVIQWIKKGWIKSLTTLGGHRRIPMSEIRRIRGEMIREVNKIKE
jgi:excisionase family DNA binding protein